MNRIIISDFDSTITRKDTIHVLTKLPYLIKPNFTPKWNHFNDLYLRNLDKLHPKILTYRQLPLLPPKFRGFNSVANYKDILSKEFEYQNLLRDLEMSSTDEITRYRLFEGISFRDVERYVESLKVSNHEIVRPDFFDFMRLSNVPAKNFYILSVNWSSEFIRCVVEMEGPGCHLIEVGNILCNDLTSDKNGVYTGEFSNTLLTGADKVEVMETNILRNLEKDADPWYIGDSEADILCILHPLVNGVLFVDPSKSLDDFLELSVKLLGLPEDIMCNFFNDSRQLTYLALQKGNGKRCYLTKSWHGIAMLLNTRVTG